jgi:hypothetical protein
MPAKADIHATGAVDPRLRGDAGMRERVPVALVRPASRTDYSTLTLPSIESMRGSFSKWYIESVADHS